MKLVAVVPVQMMEPDGPNAIVFVPALKLEVLETLIVALGSVSGSGGGLPVSVVRPGSTEAAKILPAEMLGGSALSTRFDAHFVPLPEQVDPVYRQSV